MLLWFSAYVSIHFLCIFGGWRFVNFVHLSVSVQRLTFFWFMLAVLFTFLCSCKNHICTKAGNVHAHFNMKHLISETAVHQGPRPHRLPGGSRRWGAMVLCWCDRHSTIMWTSVSGWELFSTKLCYCCAFIFFLSWRLSWPTSGWQWRVYVLTTASLFCFAPSTIP